MRIDASIIRRNQRRNHSLSVYLCVCLVSLAAGCSRLPAPTPAATPTREIQPSPTIEQPSWVLLNAMPDDTTQIDKGAEIYRLVCKACHGDVGQGLTSDWLAQWAPEDRNCWQSKCHAENHPPDGFSLPVYVPPVVGPQIAARFSTAQDLYIYNRITMPWHAPGTMLDQEYWDVTAYMLSINGFDLAGTLLGPDNAETIRLQ